MNLESSNDKSVFLDVIKRKYPSMVKDGLPILHVSYFNLGNRMGSMEEYDDLYKLFYGITRVEQYRSEYISSLLSKQEDEATSKE